MMQRNYPSVAIVVLTWNQCELTLDCLASLAALDYPSDWLQIVVVDNGSTDGTVQAIGSHFPDVSLLENDENLGYAGGNNVGIRYALAQGVDYVCVLNNDAVLAPDCVTMLVAEAERDKDIGIVGPKMYFSEPNDMIFAAGSRINWSNGTLLHRGIWQREDETGPLYDHAVTDVDFIVGCCVLVRRQLLDTVGLLDTRYFLNFEDVDWCVRAWEAGYRVRYTPKAMLWHKVSASLGQASPRNTYYMTRNALLFFWTHLNGSRRWQTVARIFFRNLGHIIVWTLKPGYRRTARGKRDANLLALRDALLGRFGQGGSDLEAICQRK